MNACELYIFILIKELNKRQKIVLCLVFMVVFAACMDKDLDLTNVDDNMRIEVKDLALSLSCDTVKLCGLIKEKDGGLIRVVRNENGDSVYAVVKEGNFESKSVKLSDENIVKLEQMLGDKVKLFTGEVEYEFEPFDIPEVNMNGLPAMLKGNGTKITLGEPQLYMELFNPLMDYGAWMEAGLRLMPMKGEETRECMMDNGCLLHTSPDQRLTTFVLAPVKPEKTLQGWGTPEFLPFTDLKYLLRTGGGVPDKIEVEVTDARLPLQRVVNVPMEKSLGGVEGYYSFYVPLVFSEGSIIEYSDTLSFTGGMEHALNIRYLKLEGVATMGMPMEDVVVSVQPLCENDERALERSFSIAKDDKDKPFELTFDFGKEALKRLEGIAIKTVFRVSDNEKLKPSHYVAIKDLRIKVDGYYEK